MPILNHTENVQISGGTFLDIAGDAYGVAGPMVVHDFIDEEGNVVAAGGNDVDEFEEGGNDDYEDHDDHDDEEERRQRPTGLTTTWPLDVGGTVINGGTFVDVAGNVYNIHHHHHYYYRRRRRSEESESDGECADKEGTVPSIRL
ncbi:hypothetical protein CC1G_10736 [Coprinopsis cinerea okayama7|uniref:Uncharacterized protein n=1 Tax=Coprinopsis cinerea (strain Okayama-7 / 130 / ATCC MYA-4618 / FGSC 9003) TaxID=240176 RepID=A8P387_COPC7|nr:hypothetical protein CC1G_10736 [Coprinopsis cinerea okayama7\|eukprot:XP_001838494.2 hypothetical protein CC1G_10736 [Coprinopsis cinerea okayama7\